MEIEAIRAAVAGNPKICSANEVLEVPSAEVRMLPNKLIQSTDKSVHHPADMTDQQAQASPAIKMTQRIIPGQGEDGRVRDRNQV